MTTKTRIFTGLSVLALIFLLMGLFSFLKKRPAPFQQTSSVASAASYEDSATDLMYNLLFCDSLDLYKNGKPVEKFRRLF